MACRSALWLTFDLISGTYSAWLLRTATLSELRLSCYSLHKPLIVPLAALRRLRRSRKHLPRWISANG